MNPSDILAVVDQAHERIQELLQSSADLEPRAAGLAGLLSRHWPQAPLRACLLCRGGQFSLAAIGEDGAPARDWHDRLRPGKEPTAEQMRSAWAAAFGGRGSTALVRVLNGGGAWHGLVALRLPLAPESAEAVLASAALGTLARTLSVLLTLEATSHEVRQLQEDLLDQQRLANTGELAGVVAHEFTNFLNVLLLHMSVLGYQLPQNYRADLEEVSRQGREITEVVRQFQQYRHGQAPRPESIALNEMLVEVADEFVADSPAPLPVRLANSSTSAVPAETVTLRLELGSEVPAVIGTRQDLRRLLRFLVSNACRAAVQQAGSVTIRTQLDGRRVILSVEDSGATVTEADLPHVFDLNRPGREGVEPLELAVARYLVQRLGGTIRGENCPESGLRVVVEFNPTA